MYPIGNSLPAGWVGSPTGDASSQRRLERASAVLPDGLLRISLHDTAREEDCTLYIDDRDGAAVLRRLDVGPADDDPDRFEFNPPLLLWPTLLTSGAADADGSPGSEFTASSRVTAVRDGRTSTGTATHTLRLMTGTGDDFDARPRLHANVLRAESEFVFELGPARVTRSSMRWLRVTQDRSGNTTAVDVLREQRTRTIKAWILPAKTRRSDWSALDPLPEGLHGGISGSEAGSEAGPESE